MHAVTIKAFAIGQYEVTFEEYDKFAIDTNRPFPGDQGWDRGRRPVINVSWYDARDYAEWLSKQTGKRYRLPTESEWEYAARSRDTADVWAGTSEEEKLPEFAVYSVNSHNRTELVGEKKPNALGLYDMSGNVFEWVEDCVHNDYADAPVDGSAWLQAGGGECGRRVIRGGSWGGNPGYLRASFRGRNGTVHRNYGVGFRLAQDLP